ncbi:MAG: aldo/keto reductase [Chloroflexi bacterium]|nr:aldo/keto reductase [Chloroflexota bacterium]
MQYRKLGRTGLWVSAVCMGTMTFGNQASEADSVDIVRRALDAGVNFFDTADMYAEGRSEEIVGKALKNDRHAVVLATKVGQRVAPGHNGLGLSRRHIVESIEGSLRRLGTDYIDLYYAHLADPDTPLDETLRAFDDLVRQGKVRYIACSNFRAWLLCKALWESDKRGLARFDCVQPPYNLLTRDIEYELLPLCASEGVGVCAYNPLAGGLLSGKHDPSKPPAAGTRFTLERTGQLYYDRYWTPANFEAVASLAGIARQRGRSLAQMSLAWILGNPAITSVIYGASSLEQFEENLGATEITLSPEELAACDEVWQRLRPLRFFYGTQQVKR